ncbi:MAG: carbohydrate binding family 9 domain-containing protein [Bacteroidetes bacterium]|nr:carbohydrate binding family 9 domain-containing protein [Bacteroidota bacterium]
MRSFALLALLFTVSTIFNNVIAQDTTKIPITAIHREVHAKHTSLPVKIDGLLNDEAWKDATEFSDYTEFRPKIGRKEDFANRTVCYLMYADDGFYFGGYCHERTKDSIAMELSGRDGFGTNDYIGLIIDTYKDHLNGFEYFLTPLGEQWDAKMSPADNSSNNGGEDFTWNAVWESAVAMHDDGWSFEMFIPYSAIRFAKKDMQDWGINITRRRRKTEQQVTWNPIDPNVNGFLTQEGYWTGIANIKPPLRLQFSPYLSTYVDHYPAQAKGDKSWTSSLNGGMDVKYGINQAFTLDATLIPDFGQVPSDNRILNLSPFEVKYTENRPFFTEGTELFNKGGLFYTRRIGVNPSLVHDPMEYGHPNEIADKVPVSSKLINATKLSGRNSNGLGIGLLNAVTNTRYATLLDTITGQRRKVAIEPLTNYNVFVLDQSLKNNSSITFLNNNVWRSGSDYDANVAAGLFSINDKTNTWNVSGKFGISTLTDYPSAGRTTNGYGHSLSFNKTSGHFNFTFQQDLIGDKFSFNDLGQMDYNNYIKHYIWMGYHWNKPTTWYNNLNFNFNASYSRRLAPGDYQNANFNINANGQMKNLWYAGALIGYEPHYNDFFEPHTEGRVFKGWSDYFTDIWFQTNSSKKYNLYSEFLYIKRSLFSSERYMINFNQRYRFSNKFSINYQITMSPQNNNVGFVDKVNDDIIFGMRDIKNVENIAAIKYSFNDKMSINTNIRHYWIRVVYQEFFTLLPDGGLEKNSWYNVNQDKNQNYFNVDMVYTWQFAPGSFLTIVWKNAVDESNKYSTDGYLKNLHTTLHSDADNNLSVKVIYFLDYLKLKKKKKNIV